MKRSGNGSTTGFTVGIAALFLAGFFLLVVFGAQSYRATVTGQNENMHTRALLSYLAAEWKASDASGAAEVRHAAEGDVLILADGANGYGLRIYCRDGMLLEEYARLDAPLDPASAQPIGETAVFRAERLEEDLLSVTTDAGRVLLRCRSEEGLK